MKSIRLKVALTNPKGRWDWGPTADPPSQGTQPLPRVSAMPEAFFDTIVINGGVYPKVSVAPKRVRFRMLNGSQARFYHLNLYPEDRNNPGEARVGTPGPVMYQVGTEGGFLPSGSDPRQRQPIPLDPSDPSENSAKADGPFNLLLAPAERADVVIDFNGVPAGSSFILYNDAPAPFPGGDRRNDYFTGCPGPDRHFGGAPTTQPGSRSQHADADEDCGDRGSGRQRLNSQRGWRNSTRSSRAAS